MAEPKPAAERAFNSYIAQVESRLEQQRRSATGFLAKAEWDRVRGGKQVIEQVAPSTGTDLPGAMLHHWRGTAFAPGAKAADFERLMKDFPAYPKRYAPQDSSADTGSKGTTFRW